jgi:hypothetical protein
MRLPGTIVNMRTARVPQKKDNAARANSRRVMMQEGDEKLSLKIPSHQAESGERASQQHYSHATVRNNSGSSSEQIDTGDAAETIRSGAGLWESVWIIRDLEKGDCVCFPPRALAIMDNGVEEAGQIDGPTGGVKYVYSVDPYAIYGSAYIERRMRCEIGGQTEKVVISVVRVPAINARAILRNITERG